MPPFAPIKRNGKNYVKQFCVGKVKNCSQLSKMKREHLTFAISRNA